MMINFDFGKGFGVKWGIRIVNIYVKNEFIFLFYKIIW